MSQSHSAIALQACTPVSLTAQPPYPGAQLLPRPHVTAQLLDARQRLCLLCAPAGYGKTSLIRQTLALASTDRHIVQLNLAGQAMPLSRFCARIAQQLGVTTPGLDSGPSLLDMLEGLPAPCTLVLDDYPVGASAELDAWLDTLLLHSSAPVQLWVSCRQRPTWNLPRLFLEGQLLELDHRTLAFSRRESDELISLSMPALADTLHHDIWQRTLGWCAGTRLLLTAQARDSQLGALLLRDYLEREVLSHLRAEERQLLQGLAYLPRVSEQLCAQLWEGLDTRTDLRKLLHAHTFFQPLDRHGQWYRLLPAVAQALQGAIDASELKRLRLCACRELSAVGFIEDAIDLALSAGQTDVAVNYMASLAPSWLLAGNNLARILQWREQVPPELRHSTVPLVVLDTCTLAMHARLDEAQACLEHLGRFLPQQSAAQNRRLLAHWQALHGVLQGNNLGNCASAREHCQAALEHLGEDQRQVAFLCTITLARQAMSTGETTHAQQLLMAAIEQARRQGDLATEVLINSQRICLMILCGESDLARRLLQESLGLLHADDGHHVTLLGRLHVLQGKLHLQRGDLDACEQALRQVLREENGQAMPALHALTGLSEVYACRGDIQQAFTLLQEAERRMQCANVQESSYRAVLNLQSLSLLIHQKNWKQALPMALTIEQYLRGPAARLTGLMVPSLPVHSQLLLALVEQGAGQYQAAHNRLQNVQRECLRLNFHGLQNKVQRVLDSLSERAEPPQHIPLAGSFNLLVSEARTVQPRQPADLDAKASVGLKQRDALSGREIGVLELLAEGLSNREISERLYISTNTVKAHIKHINSKLGVTRRAQAVMRAKAMGLLA